MLSLSVLRAIPAPITQAIDNEKRQCGACFVCDTVCDETCASNTARNVSSPDWRIRQYRAVTAALTEFRYDLIDLITEWKILNDWLAYRHMVSYWLGLVDWRNNVYNDQPYKPVIEAARSQSRLHYAKQYVLSSVKRLRLTDEGYFKLTCSSFRQVQREHRKVFNKLVKGLEKEYAPVVGESRLRRSRKRMEDYTGGLFPVTREFDPDMLVGERALIGDIEFGTVERRQLCEALCHVRKEWGL